MSRRTQDQQSEVIQSTNEVQETDRGVVTSKIAIVDTDILFHWSMTFVGEDATLQEALVEVEKVILNFEKNLEAKAYVYFIKGKGNFRYTVATMKPYKGTRTSEKHRYYDEMLEHMTKFRDCIVCNFLEADDMISIFHDERTVACTIDKDAKQTAGSLYNFTKIQIEEISEEDAWKTLWLQVITGDSVDNIGGIQGIGPAKADKILVDVPAEDYPMAVQQAYIEKYGLSDGADFYNENFQLIRMKTSSGDYIKERYKDIFLLIDALDAI